MATKVYGASDDLIEVDGDVTGEVGYSNDKEAALLVFDDGTQLAVQYGKPGGQGIWHLVCLRAGALFDRIDVCTDEDGDIYSDVAHFKDGLKSAIAATKWERVR
jgi:hypothetical protein